MTVLEAIFGKLDRRKQQRRQEGWPRYREMMEAAIEDPNSVDPEELQASLDAQGKSREDFAKDLDIFTKRKAWANDYEVVPDLQLRQAEIENALEDADAELQKAMQIHAAKVEPLRHEHASIIGKLATATQAEVHLTDTCQNPEIIAERERLSERIREISRRIDQLGYQLHPSNGPNTGELGASWAWSLSVAKQRLTELEKQPQDYGTESFHAGDIKALQERIRPLEEKVSLAEKEVTELNSERDQISRKIETLQERMREV